MKTLRGLKLSAASLALGALALAAPASASSQASTSAMPAIHVMGILNGSNGNGNGPSGSSSTNSNLIYNGGTSDGFSVPIGVETTPMVYLVFWGSQWLNNDPSGEATILESFFQSVGGSGWNNTVTQYCQGIPSLTSVCPNSPTSNNAGNPPGLLAGYWSDTSAAPSHPRQSQLAAEAVNAAAHFLNTAVASNQSVQYVIATSHGNSSSGFGTRYCAWHSSTTSKYGDVAYTNLPYITDAGSSCGANFISAPSVNLGLTEGITIVGGHEFAETETDQFPSTGWTDSSGAEIGDKCAWNPATAFETFPNGSSFAVQPLWSNAAQGCVQSGP